jgi:hypothetical protein
MRFKNNIIDSKVNEAVKIANNLLNTGSALIEHISKKDDFQYNSGNGIQIAINLIKVREPINVYIYKPFYPFSKAIGYYDGEAIWINARKMQVLDISNLVGLLLHEYAHYCGYKHGNNYKSKEKCLYSVPYYLSENIKLWN